MSLSEKLLGYILEPAKAIVWEFYLTPFCCFENNNLICYESKHIMANLILPAQHEKQGQRRIHTF